MVSLLDLDADRYRRRGHSAVPETTVLIAAPALARRSERARAYRGIGELLRAGRPEALDDARAIIGPSGASSRAPSEAMETLARTIAGATQSELDREWHHLRRADVFATCAFDDQPVRRWACIAADIAPDRACATDLLVLTGLDDRVIWSAKLGRMELAAAILERRNDFFLEHVAHCGGALAVSLIDHQTPLLGAAGRALAELIDGELADHFPDTPHSVIQARRRRATIAVSGQRSAVSSERSALRVVRSTDEAPPNS